MINTKKIDSFIEGKRGAVIEGEGFITTGEPARSPGVGDERVLSR